jgi:type III restriction enzyme
LLELLDQAQEKREGAAFQNVFDLPEVVVDPAVVFRFSNLAYPMRWACPAPMEWKKHFYSVPGDLPYLKKDNTPAEEFLCALAIERCKDVDVWVRNLFHPTQFKFPTASGATYPDFVARLKDGRIFVIEYKGEDRYESSKNQAKRAIGELWARKNPNGIYLMAVLKDDQGQDVGEQIAVAIATKRR